MPGPACPLVGFVLGLAFSRSALDEINAVGSWPQTRAFTLVACFGLFVFGPATAVILSLAPDWAYAYFLDTERLPPLTQFALVLASAISCPLGFAAGSTRPASQSLRLAAVPLVLALGLLVATLSRIRLVASYAQYHGDFGTRSLAGSPLGYALLWLFCVLVAAVVWTARSLREFGTSSR